MDIEISNKQKQFLELMEDPTVTELLVGGAAGGGKSYSIGMIVALWARKYPGVRFFIGRKTLKSLKQSTINTMLSKVFPALGITSDDYHMGWQSMELRFKNDSLVIFGELGYQPSDPVYSRVGSLEIDVAIVDEAGEITRTAKDAIKSRTGRGVMAQRGMPGKLLLGSNPDINWLKDEYYDPYEKLGGGGFQKWQIGTIDINGEKRPTYRAFLQAGAYDNPFLPQSYIDNLKTLPPILKKRLLDGNWNYADDESSLFRAGLLDKAMCYETPDSSVEDTFIGCFDETTEILTESGFKKFKDLNGEKVLARKPSGSSEYINYDNYIEYDYCGDMYSLENQGASVFVTPNHKMLYAAPRGETELEEIQNISLSEWKIIRKHDYHYGLFQDEFPFYLGYSKKDFFAFLGWFISEGCVVGDAVVNITQRTPEKKDVIRKLLRKMNIRFSESSQNFAIHNKKLAGWLLDNVKKYAHNKEIPRMVVYCSNWSYIEAFLDAYCDGDGMRRNGGRLCYVSSSKKIIDSLQIILSHFNRQGRISLHNKAGTKFMIEGRQAERKHDTYVLYERDTDVDAWVKKKQIKKVPFKGKVYCVSNKYHTIYVRRKGVCYWIGNCDLADSGGDRTVFSLMKKGVLVAQKLSTVQMNWEKESKLPMGRLVTDELVEFAQRNGIDQRFAGHIAVEINGVGASCLPAGELITTTKKKIAIENVQKGDTLYSKDGKPTKIKQLLDYNYNGNIYEIIPYGFKYGHKFTEEHPIWASKTLSPKKGIKEEINHNFKWWKASEIEPLMWIKEKNVYQEIHPMPDFSDYDFCLKPNRYASKTEQQSINKIVNDKDFWWVVGYWLGDGWLQNLDKKGEIHFCYNLQQLEFQQKVEKWAKKINRKATHYRKPAIENSVIRCHNLARWFYDNFGEKAKGKYIPEWVKFIPREYKIALLQGYFDSDGTNGLHPSKGQTIYRIGWSSVNYRLLEDIKCILDSLELSSCIQERTLKKGYKPGAVGYTLYLGSYASVNLNHLFEPDCKLLKVDYLQKLHNRRQYCYYENGWIYRQINKVKTSQYIGKVYNFSTEDETFMAGRIPTHNCRDFLRERGWQVLEYTATHKSRSENYYNLMMDMDAGDVKIYHEMIGLDDLRRELMSHSFEMSNQEPSVVKKDKIKQAIGHSPDLADSFQICNYARRMAEHPELDPRTNKNRIFF